MLRKPGKRSKAASPYEALLEINTEHNVMGGSVAFTSTHINAIVGAYGNLTPTRTCSTAVECSKTSAKPRAQLHFGDHVSLQPCDHVARRAYSPEWASPVAIAYFAIVPSPSHFLYHAGSSCQTSGGT